MSVPNACKRTIKSAGSQTIAVLLVASTAVADRDADETETFIGWCVDFDVEDSCVLLALLLWSIESIVAICAVTNYNSPFRS